MQNIKNFDLNILASQGKARSAPRPVSAFANRILSVHVVPAAKDYAGMGRAVDNCLRNADLSKGAIPQILLASRGEDLLPYEVPANLSSPSPLGNLRQIFSQFRKIPDISLLLSLELMDSQSLLTVCKGRDEASESLPSLMHPFLVSPFLEGSRLLYADFRFLSDDYAGAYPIRHGDLVFITGYCAFDSDQLMLYFGINSLQNVVGKFKEAAAMFAAIASPDGTTVNVFHMTGNQNVSRQIGDNGIYTLVSEKATTE